MDIKNIPRNAQIMIYAAILCLVVIFFFYFYRQASLTENDFSAISIGGGKSNVVINSAVINMNLNLFGSDKFLNLRSEVAPTQSFQSGKRDPFAPQ